MGELGVEVNEEQEADELADVGGGNGNQHLGVVFGSTPSGLINRVDLLSESRIYLGSP